MSTPNRRKVKKEQMEPVFKLAGKVIDELKAENKLLLESLKIVVRTAQDIPFYFTDKIFKPLRDQTEKAKEAIKNSEA